MSKVIPRVISRMVREFANLGIAPKFQPFTFIRAKENIGEISILVVASGTVPIPAQGWGAVETIIAETIPEFIRSGISVGLLNTQNYFEWKRAQKLNFDVIICHSDSHLRKVKNFWPNTPTIAVTHYGLAAQPALWHPSYSKIFREIQMADKVVCLSPAIFDKFSELMPREKLALLGNGSNLIISPNNSKSGGLVMLGKVEPRKRQYELWQFALENEIDIQFLGPIADPRVLEHMNRDRSLYKYFKGPKSRTELISELPGYMALILLSEGEADALVLYEAQLAGLEIITNSESIGSQDSKLPWIHIIKDLEQLKQILNRISKKPFPASEIGTYANENYRWSKKLIPLIEIIRELAQHEKR